MALLAEKGPRKDSFCQKRFRPLSFTVASMALLAGIGPRSRSHKLYRRVDDMSWPEKGHAKIPFAGLETDHAKLSWASEVVVRPRKLGIANE